MTESDPFAAALAHLEAHAAEYFGASPVRLERREEHAGGFTRVLRLRVCAGSRREDVFVKTFVPRSTEAEEIGRQRGYLDAETERLAAAARAFERTPGLQVPRLIASLPDALTLITAGLRGTRLDAVLRRALLIPTPGAVRRAEMALRSVGEWLRRFQQQMPPRDPAAVHKDYRAYLDARLRQLAGTPGGAFTASDRRAALADFDALAARLSADDRQPAAAHADLCPANVLVTDDGVGVIDLAMSTDRLRTLDLAHMYFHVELMARRRPAPRRVVARLQRALLDGFSPAFDPQSPLFRLMLLQHAVCHLVQCADSRPNAAASRPFRRRMAWALHLARRSGATQPSPALQAPPVPR
jgi:Phosphotransferase enzyme family